MPHTKLCQPRLVINRVSTKRVSNKKVSTNRATTNTRLPSIQKRRATRVLVDADLEEDPKSKKICKQDNSSRSQLVEVLPKTRGCSIIQSKAYRLPKSRRSRWKWKRLKDQLNQVVTTHRSSRRFLRRN
jgi:hypothetical protein